MADLSLVTDNFFATASETFTDNLSGSIAAGAPTVPVNSAVEYATGEVVVLTVEPGTSNEATFIGEKDTTNQFINCIWTEGNTAVGHDAGATIIDYDSATHFNALSKGIQQFANQDGTLIEQAVRDALGLGAGAVDGWEVFPYTFTVSSGYNAGNRRYSLTVANQDVRSTLSKGMWLRGNRASAGATQCADFESSSSQYASRASGSLSGSITSFTDDITTEAWIKPESLSATYNGIVSRYTSSGWILMLNDGTIHLQGSNSTGPAHDYIRSRQKVTVGRWQHIAATIDLSGTTGTIYINGVSVTADYTNGAQSTITQVGNLEIGSWNGSNFFDGLISDVRVWNTVRTATQIRDNMNQQLVGSETNLVGYWKLDGNFNDSTSAGNNLTANGGAIATYADTPHGNWYGKIVDISYSAPNSTVVIQGAEGYDVPNMVLSAPYYSVQENPYGAPVREKFKLSVWEATPANDVAANIIEEATDSIGWNNTGSAGGGFYYGQIGKKKYIEGVSASFSTSTGTSNVVLTFPSSFFNQIDSCVGATRSVASIAQQFFVGNGISTSQWAFYIFCQSGSGSATAGIRVTGQ